MWVDLHVHSHNSDGLHSPSEVYRMASEAGLDVLALTDHDTVGGFDAAREFVTDGGPALLPAVEVTTTHGNSEVHILGYFGGDVPVAVREFLARTQDERRERIRAGCERLRSLGVDLAFEEVEERCVGEAIGRSHIARALVDRGTVRTIQQAFKRYLAAELEIVPHASVTVAAAIEAVTAGGGVSVWAHPSFDQFDEEIESFREMGLDGVEIHTPRGRGVRGLYVEKVAEELGLLAGGGSDWHGFPGQGRLGRFKVAGKQVAALLVRVGLLESGGPPAGPGD